MKLQEEETPHHPQNLHTTTTHLLNSLLSSIPETQIFKSKWSLVKTKLNSLAPLLSHLPPSQIPTHPLSLDLLTSLSSTLSTALCLALTCHSLTLPKGKLQTQNDVDSIISQLDSHVHDFQILIKSNLLTQNAAVPINSSTSKRESVRAESRTLLTRLQLGSTESKNSVLDSLLLLLMEDDKNVLIAVAQGIVPVLVRLLDSSSSLEIKEKSVTAISRVSTVDSSKHVLIAEGLPLLSNLLRVIESGSVFAKEKSCIALQVLSNSRENARAIAAKGGVSGLLEICQVGTPNSQALAAGVLRNLSVFEEIKENFIEENGILILLVLLGTGIVLAQENALGCLCNLLKGDEKLKILVAREGGIERLINFWDSSPGVSGLEVCVEMLRSLAECELIGEVLVQNGFLSRVLGVLNCGGLGVRVGAARAVYNLGFNTKTRKELGEVGCVGALVRMLDGKALEEREASAKALSNLMVYAGNRRIFRKEEGGIVTAVQLLDPSVQGFGKKYAVLVLNSLVHSKKCRKQMVACGACVHLQRLVEMDVDGAKKLLDCLGRGRLWGVFTRP